MTNLCRIYKMYYFLDSEMKVEKFTNYNDMEEFIENYDVEVFKVDEYLAKINY